MSTANESKSSLDVPESHTPAETKANPASEPAKAKLAGANPPNAAPRTAGNNPAPSGPAAGNAGPVSRPTQTHPAQQHPAQQHPTQTRPVQANGHMAPNTPGRPPADDEGDEPDEFVDALGGWLSTVPAWLVSMVFHIAMLLILALLTLNTAVDNDAEISLHDGDDPTKLEEVEDVPLLDDALNKDDQLETVNLETNLEIPVPTADLQQPELAASNSPLVDLSEVTAVFNADAMPTTISGDSLLSRGASVKGQLLRQGGGTPESEEAVRLALEWLANHQYPDGSWSFDHRRAQRCNSRCSAPGSIGTRQPDSPYAATALGILPFLGAGFTHKEGKHRGVVDKGIQYLLRNQAPNGSWHEQTGTMYSHGLCAIAICEAYAMTEDKELRDAAQRAIDYIEFAQDKSGGGWRYFEGMAGDTSVVGWQVMALKSAQMAYLEVQPRTILLAENFLESVSRQSGAYYGYLQPEASKTLTSVGLLCRMYMGWKQDHPALARGVSFLSEQGPDTISNDVYYNYYATQVLRHYDGPMWTKWNEELREHLIRTQVKREHARGSWFSEGSYNKTGGRHYTTAMSCMILEVYYRHMPLYKETSNLGFDVGDAFKQDGDGDGGNDQAADGNADNQAGDGAAQGNGAGADGAGADDGAASGKADDQAGAGQAGDGG